MRRALAMIALAACGCRDWRDRVEPNMAVKEPAQVPVEKPPFLARGATLTPRARYTTKAWVAAADRDIDDAFEVVIPLDVSLLWGPLANRDILKEMSFHLARRYVSVRWSQPLPIDQQVVMTHLANTHLIPSSPEIAKYLEHVKPGDLLFLDGLLVDVALAGAPPLRTSLFRDDIGNGACEILYVEKAEITRPGR